MFQAVQAQQQEYTAHLLQKARFVCLDIETGDAPESAIQAALAGWEAPKNIKDETKIEARREEAAAKIRDRAALLDASPILCVAVQTDATRMLFNAMNSAVEVPGWQVVNCGGEECDMLNYLRAFLDQCTDIDTDLVGQNIQGFDAPKLRAAYVRYRLKLPRILSPSGEQPMFDTMRRYKSFSMENRDNLFINLDTICNGLNIPRPKQHMDGALVPELHRQGRCNEICVYCAIDTAATTQAYLLMTSQAGDME